MTTIALLPDLLTLTAQAAPAAEAVCDIAKTKLRALVSDEGRVVNSRIEEHQTAAHGFAWVATYVESLRHMQNWAEALQASDRLAR